MYEISPYPVVQQVRVITDDLVVIGDVHGCVRELRDLLYRVTPGRNVTVAFTGDLVDRGPDSAGVVSMVRGMGAYCVLGNHEEKHIRYRRHEAQKKIERFYRNPMKASPSFMKVHQTLSDKQIDWLSRLPAAIRFVTPAGDRILTHAGLTSSRFDQPTDGFIRNRRLDKNGKPVSLSHATEQNSSDWTESYFGPRSIYGHIVNNVPFVQNDTYGIDTGCCFGISLTAYYEHFVLTRYPQHVIFFTVKSKQPRNDYDPNSD